MDWDRVIYNGTVVNDDGMQRADIYIRDGRVAAVTSERLPGTVGEATDASGRYILPGLIETHVHSRDGRLATGEKEDFRSSTAAAAATGITTVFEMPNCTPTIHSAESLRDLVSVIQPKAHADFCVWGLALGDANLASLPALAEAGCVAFKFFWGYAVDRRDNSLRSKEKQPLRTVMRRSFNPAVSVGVTMEELLEAGFAPEYSIAFANRCMSRRNKGRIFTTFDMVVIDMYDGTMRSFKQGASVTYVIRPGDDGNEVRQITSTTLPVGVLDDAECDMADVKLAAGDAVVMVSDGLSDMDVSDHMQDVLKGIRVGDSRRMVDDILGAMIGQGDVSLRDDVTVMAAVISGSEKSSAA